MKPSLPILRGRGANGDPPSRFLRLSVEPDPEFATEAGSRPTEYYLDASRSVLTRNQSPDVPFDWSLNPYRGCEHGCSYCYARPTHEFLGFSAGLDFESRILVKRAAPELLQIRLAHKNWAPVPIAMSGVTDPYQPIEQRLGITRRCLEVLERTRHPVTIVTKGRAIERDIDILSSLARHDAVQVSISVTTLDRSLQRAMEPRAPTPETRLRVIRSLRHAGVPVGINIAPVIPGLTEHEIPAILDACAEAGAQSAAMFLLRLPGAVEAIFVQWLRDFLPDRSEKVLNRLRELHGGKLSDPRFGHRMRGSGTYSHQIRELFRVARRRAGMDASRLGPSSSSFLRPTLPKRKEASTQLELEIS